MTPQLQNRITMRLVIFRADRNNRNRNRSIAAPKSSAEAYAPSRLDIIGGVVLALLTAFYIHILKVQP